MARHTAGGKINTTTVAGNAYVGTNAPDGGLHIVLDDAVNKGVYHPSGATRVNSGIGITYYDASGAVYSNKLLGPGK